MIIYIVLISLITVPYFTSKIGQDVTCRYTVEPLLRKHYIVDTSILTDGTNYIPYCIKYHPHRGHLCITDSLVLK